MENQTTPATKLIPLREVLVRTMLGKTRAYELIDAGDFRPVRIGRRIAFVEAEIDAWIQQRISERDDIKAAA